MNLMKILMQARADIEEEVRAEHETSVEKLQRDYAEALAEISMLRTTLEGHKARVRHPDIIAPGEAVRIEKEMRAKKTRR